MGFGLQHVLTDENLVQEFICAICQQLADPPAYTQCTCASTPQPQPAQPACRSGSLSPAG